MDKTEFRQFDGGTVAQQSEELKKIVFTDNGSDKAITGKIVGEDDYFIIIEAKGREYRLGKKSIVLIKDFGGDV